MMVPAFPNLDELAALALNAGEDRERIREILRSWPTASLALLAKR